MKNIFKIVLIFFGLFISSLICADNKGNFYNFNFLNSTAKEEILINVKHQKESVIAQNNNCSEISSLNSRKKSSPKTSFDKINIQSNTIKQTVFYTKFSFKNKNYNKLSLLKNEIKTRAP